MDFQEIMTSLKENGTEQNIKIYKRHGAGNNLFGVSFAHLNALTKKIKLDHSLAQKLWKTKNVDAQILAAMVADPEKITEKELNLWINSVSYYTLADYVAALVVKSSFAHSLMKQWTSSKKEYVQQAGYTLLSLLVKDANLIDDKECKQYIEIIEKNIHSTPNRAKHAMNMALIAIGIYRDDLREVTLKTVDKIGKVNVDHGKTSCKTPDARTYIIKTINRKKRKN